MLILFQKRVEVSWSINHKLLYHPKTTKKVKPCLKMKIAAFVKKVLHQNKNKLRKIWICLNNIGNKTETQGNLLLILKITSRIIQAIKQLTWADIDKLLLYYKIGRSKIIFKQTGMKPNLIIKSLTPISKVNRIALIQRVNFLNRNKSSDN